MKVLPTQTIWDSMSSQDVKQIPACCVPLGQADPTGQLHNQHRDEISRAAPGSGAVQADTAPWRLHNPLTLTLQPQGSQLSHGLIMSGKIHRLCSQDAAPAQGLQGSSTLEQKSLPWGQTPRTATLALGRQCSVQGDAGALQSSPRAPGCCLWGTQLCRASPGTSWGHSLCLSSSLSSPHISAKFVIVSC